MSPMPHLAAARFLDESPESSRFFRDRAGLRALAARLETRTGEGRQEPVRIWVASSTVGEDAYSACITLVEKLGAGAGVRVFGTARQRDAVTKARRAFYETDSLSRRLSGERLARFFVADHGGYRVRSELRRRCVFAVHDLAEDLPFLRLDGVVCPLPLKHMHAESRERVLGLFHFALKPGGLLLLADKSVAPERGRFERLGPGLYMRPRAAAPASGRDVQLLLARAAAVVRDQWRGLEPAGVDGAPRKRHEDLVAMVSHELRTPLASIIGFTQTLKGGIDDPRRRRAFLNTIEKNALRLRNTVDGLLGLVDGRTRRSVPVDLGRAARAAVAALRPVAASSKVQVRLDLAPGLLAQADPGDLPHVFENLIGNAIRYNRKGGRVQVTGWREGSFVAFSVADTGCGIPPQALERIFERFYRCDETSHVKGNGLGLAIVRSLVEANGGRVSVQSPPGAGATFTVLLPCALRRQPRRRAA